jgi:quercetin dioxygenase-like cupin family protein
MTTATPNSATSNTATSNTATMKTGTMKTGTMKTGTIETGATAAALPPDLMAQIAIGLGRSGASHLVPAGSERRWALALEADSYEAWVIAWPAGSGLAMHDHDGSAACVYVVNGSLRERFVDADGEVAVRWMNAGETFLLPHDHAHEMINLDSDEVVSVHVYSPRLRDQTFRETQSLA